MHNGVLNKNSSEKDDMKLKIIIIQIITLNYKQIVYHKNKQKIY